MKRSVMIVIAFLLLFSMQMSAQTFSVQGVLRDVLGKTVDDGSYQLNFKLYEQASGGSEIWSEIQNDVQIIHGVFSIELGSVASLDAVPFDTTYWVGIAAEGGTEMTPRLKLTRAPSAMSLYSSANVIPLIGNIGIGTHVPEAALHIKTPTDDYDKLLIEGADGTDYVKVTGDGKMGINVATPTQALDIDGNIRVRSGGIMFADSSILNSADMGGAASAIANTGTAPIIADADEDGIGTIDLKIGDSTRVRIHNDGNTTFAGDITATQLIDNVDPSYYVDPNSSSSLYLLGVNGDTATTGYPLSVAGDIKASKIVHPDNTFYINPNSSSKFPTKLCLGGANSFSHPLVISGNIYQSGSLYKNGSAYNTSLWDLQSGYNTYIKNNVNAGYTMIGSSQSVNNTNLTIGGYSDDPGAVLLTAGDWDSAADSVTLNLSNEGTIKARYGQGLEFHVFKLNQYEDIYYDFYYDKYKSITMSNEDGIGFYRGDYNQDLGSAALYWSAAHAHVMYIYTEYALSDSRVKSNIEDLDHSLDKIMALHGIRYGINRATHPFYKDRKLRKAEEPPVNLGFIAQELQSVIPEMVEFNEDYQLYTIRNYEQMLPVVVAAVQELKAAKDQKITTLKERIELLLAENQQLVKRVANLAKN
ncbi:MAG: tail fiber domain-containing protein [Candidatus Marinimicrobia bacterium]|nr:tail fiber domain-containing protein [Candidatus Neomarinimicrobiota bacterium]